MKLGNETKVGKEEIGAKVVSIHQLLELIPPIELLKFPSNPLQNIYRQVRWVVYCNLPGSWAEAEAGAGKSTAIEYCIRALRADFPMLPVFSINEHMLPASASRSFFIRMLGISGASSTTGETARLKTRLVKHLSYLAHQSPMKLVVLFVDEGQAFRDVDLFILKDLFNDLRAYGCNLVTIFFGEKPSMGNRVQTVTTGLNAGLAQRFLGGRQLHFCQYASESDWVSFFSAVDSNPFEVYGGMTLPQFFLRQSDISGFSFKNEAKPFFKTLKKYTGTNRDIDLRTAFSAFRRVIYLLVKNPPERLTALGDKFWTAGFEFVLDEGEM